MYKGVCGWIWGVEVHHVCMYMIFVYRLKTAYHEHMSCSEYTLGLLGSNGSTCVYTCVYVYMLVFTMYL